MHSFSSAWSHPLYQAVDCLRLRVLFSQDDGPKGQFAVDRVRIVELLPPLTLGKDYPNIFQVYYVYDIVCRWLIVWVSSEHSSCWHPSL